MYKNDRRGRGPKIVLQDGPEKSVLTVRVQKLMGSRQIFYIEFSEKLTMLAVNRCSSSPPCCHFLMLFTFRGFFAFSKIINVEICFRGAFFSSVRKHPKRFLCSQELPQSVWSSLHYRIQTNNTKSSQIYNPLLLFFRFNVIFTGWPKLF